MVSKKTSICGPTTEGRRFVPLKGLFRVNRSILFLLSFFVLLCSTAISSYSEEKASPRLQWPQHWVVFAPAGEEAPPLSRRRLLSIPESLTVMGRTLEAQKVEPKGHQFDFAPFFGPDPLEQTAFVFLPLHADEAMDVCLGFGADWWMQAWLNGEQILDTTESGNEDWPPAINNHVVEVALEEGENILSVRFISGTGSSVLAIGGPRHLEEPLPPSITDREKPDSFNGNAQELADRYPPREDKRKPTPGWAPQFRRNIEPAVKERVPLNTDWGDNDTAEAMVSFGVPFPRGSLNDVSNARIVDSEGHEVAAEIRTKATWEGPDGPVRWALVHALLERGRDYFLEYGTQVNAPPLQGISIRENEEFIEIDTGVMHVVLSRTTPSIFDSVTLKKDGDGKIIPDGEIVNADHSKAELPELKDAAGNRYVAGGKDEGLEIEVVESGPNRAAVRRAGRYVDHAGDAFCHFVTYTYFYAGQAGLRHDHTLIVAFDTDQHQIRNIMLPVPLHVEENGQVMFAANSSPDGNAMMLPGTEGPYRLLQKEHDSWELHGRGKLLETGARAGGWFGLCDENKGAFGGLADFWQQYPAELEADGDVLRLHLWPREGTDPLDFRPSAAMGEDYPHDGMKNYYPAGLDEMTQAFGLGKTHNIYLNFFATPKDRERARRQSRAQVVEPVLALPDPEYICATDVMFGRLHPYDLQGFPQIEALIDGVVRRYLTEREEREQYGWIDFGDVYYAGGRLWRRWASMFYGFPNVMPRLYLRSGRRDAWDFHRVNTRHITDIDICHLDSDEFITEEPMRGESLLKIKGRRYGGDGGVCHYAGGQYRIGPDHHLAFMLYDYYLNGNLRTREVAQYYIDAHAEARDEGSMVSFGGIPRRPNMGRGTGGALRMFSEAYQATWDPEYLSIMRQLADLMITTKKEIYETEAKNVFTSYNDVYMNKGKILYYQLTGDVRMREHFLHDMEVLAQRRNEHALARGVGTTMSGPAHAYWFTGDKVFLPFMLWQFDQALERGPEWMASAFHAVSNNHGLQLPEVMAVLAEVDNLPAPEGPPVPEPENTHLGLKSNWAHYLLQEEDTEIRLTAKVDLNRERAGGDFENWAEWIEQLQGPDQPILRLLDPDGLEVGREKLSPDNTEQAIELSFPPDGKTGVYTLAPNNMTAPLSLKLTSSTLEKGMLHAGENWLRPTSGTGFFFLVPAGTHSFNLDVKTARVRGRTQYGVRNTEDRLVAEGQWDSSSTPRNDWERIDLNAGGPENSEVWSIAFNRNLETYLRFDGIPGYVASSPSDIFDPDAIRRRPVPVAEKPAGDDNILYEKAGLPWGEKAGYLNAPITIEATQGEKELFDEREGTLELWVKTVDTPSALFNRTLLISGDLRLWRRYNIGTYVNLGGASLQRFFALPNGRWTHLALTWQPSDEPGFDLDIRLFADGIEVRGRDFHRVSEGWASQALQLNGGFYVSSLRLSDSVRYQDGFKRPQSPLKADDITRLLCLFNGDETAWVLGETVHLPR